MPISSLARLRQQHYLMVNACYQADCFQALMPAVEKTLEDRLTEIFAIATSRAGAAATPIICDLALETLLHRSQPRSPIVSAPHPFKSSD